jgi:hypothetical protein
MTRSFVLRLSEFSVKALAGEGGQGSGLVPAMLVRAIRFYLSDRDSGQLGWAYPSFLRDKETGEVELELVLDEDLLRELEEEAGSQGVSVSQMAGHAALYFAAELNSGRFTQRILEGLEDDEAEGREA